MRRKTLISTGAALVFGASSFGITSAQPLAWSGPLTLTQAIARAQSAGFDVRMAQASSAASGAQAAFARTALYPQGGISETTNNGGITQLGMPTAQQTYFGSYLTVPIFVPSTWATARSARHTADAARYGVKSATNDAMLASVQAYENALLTGEIYGAREVTVRSEQRHVEDVARRAEVGATPRYLLAESQAALAQAQQSAEDAAAQRDEAVADLEVVLNVAIGSPLTLADSLTPLSLSGTEASYEARAAAQRPEVLAAQATVTAAQSRVSAARALYLPSASGSAQTYNGRSTPDLGSKGYQIGINVSLPIVDSGSRPAAVHEAQADLEHARSALERSRLSAQRDVYDAWREYEAALANLISAHAQQTAAAEALRVTVLRERSGKGITLETLEALAQDAAAREAVLRATARLNIAIAGVHHAAGDSSL